MQRHGSLMLLPIMCWALGTSCDQPTSEPDPNDDMGAGGDHEMPDDDDSQAGGAGASGGNGGQAGSGDDDEDVDAAPVEDPPKVDGAPTSTGGTAGMGGQGGAAGAAGMSPPMQPEQQPPGNGPFLAKDGRVVWDVESRPYDKDLPGDWKRQTALAGFRGTAYFRWTGPNRYSQPGQGALEYSFKLEENGLYRFAWRQYQDSAVFDLSNDAYAEFSTAESPAFYKHWFKAYGPHASFRWLWYTFGEPHGGFQGPICINFKKGTHKMRISGRSSGYSIDRIALYKFDGTEQRCRDMILVPNIELERAPLSARDP